MEFGEGISDGVRRFGALKSTRILASLNRSRMGWVMSLAASSIAFHAALGKTGENDSAAGVLIAKMLKSQLAGSPHVLAARVDSLEWGLPTPTRVKFLLSLATTFSGNVGLELLWPP